MSTVQTNNDKNKKGSTETGGVPREEVAGSERVETEPSGEQLEVVWDDSKMMTNFANVVNIQGSLEQLDICFGMNHTWSPANERPVRVELSNRVIMSPPAAKRLFKALERVLNEHEARHGKINIT